MNDPRTVDERLRAAAQDSSRREQIRDRLSQLIHISASRRRRYQHELEMGKVDRQQLLTLNDAWQKVERAIISLVEEMQKVDSRIREKRD